MTLNILDFNLFFCENCNPPEKSHPPPSAFFSNPLLKMKSYQAPLFWKFNWRFRIWYIILAETDWGDAALLTERMLNNCLISYALMLHSFILYSPKLWVICIWNQEKQFSKCRKKPPPLFMYFLSAKIHSPLISHLN